MILLELSDTKEIRQNPDLSFVTDVVKFVGCIFAIKALAGSNQANVRISLIYEEKRLKSINELLA